MYTADTDVMGQETMEQECMKLQVSDLTNTCKRQHGTGSSCPPYISGCCKVEQTFLSKSAKFGAENLYSAGDLEAKLKF